MANQDLTVTLATNIARGAAQVVGRPAKVIIGRDTRISGPMLEAALAAGFTESGCDVLLAGVVPTPALSYLIAAMGADFGVMISASHNPPQYNGIKLLNESGRKWESHLEDEVERWVEENQWSIKAERIGKILHYEDTAVIHYRRYLESIFAGRLPDWPIVLDVGHGAAVSTAPEIFRSLGMRVTVLNHDPLGELINVNCGATHPQTLRQAVLASKAKLGLAFDGDADRVIAVAEGGRIIDGDEILYVMATYLKGQGALRGDQVVATVMSNLGLEKALMAQGITLNRTPVGDRWVAQSMQESGASLGGEQSGHVILSEWTKTGDGVLTGLALIRAVWEMGLTLDEAVAPVQRYPQVLVNIPVDRAGMDWSLIPGLPELVAAAEQSLGQEGRVFIRASGTEPLMRIMLEGSDVEMINEWAHRLEAGVREALESAEA